MRGSRAKLLRKATVGMKMPRPALYKTRSPAGTAIPQFERADGYGDYRRLKKMWNRNE